MCGWTAEDDPTLSAEDRALARFQKERMKEDRGKLMLLQDAWSCMQDRFQCACLAPLLPMHYSSALSSLPDRASSDFMICKNASCKQNCRQISHLDDCRIWVRQDCAPANPPSGCYLSVHLVTGQLSQVGFAGIVNSCVTSLVPASHSFKTASADGLHDMLSAPQRENDDPRFM